MNDIRNKTISGFFWTFLQKIGSQSIAFVIMIFLARLLSPKDFGLIAMLSIFIQISQNVVDGGFNQALIQKLNVDEKDYSSVFYINIIVSFLIYAILFLIAPWVANFYNQDLLSPLLRVLALSFVINSFSLIQETKIKNELDFKKLTIIQIPSNIIGGVVALIMAFLGFGVWSIVCLQLVTRFAYAIQLWFHTKWVPMWVFEMKRVRKLFGFGGRMLFSTILTSLYSNIIIIIIGKFYPAAQVGFYQNAKTTALTPSQTIKSVADSVTFPTFSKIQNDNKTLKSAYKKVMQMLIFWTLPLFSFLGVLAVPLFQVVFGEKWVPAVPFFRWLCFIAVLSPLVNYNLNILKIKGEAKLFLRLQFYRRALTIVGMILISFSNWGISGYLFIESLSYLLSFLFFSYISGNYINYTAKEQVKDKIPMLLLTAGISLFLYFLYGYFKGHNHLLILGCGLCFSFGLYFIFSRFLKFKELTESLTILHGFVKKSKNK